MKQNKCSWSFESFEIFLSFCSRWDYLLKISTLRTLRAMGIKNVPFLEVGGLSLPLLPPLVSVGGLKIGWLCFILMCLSLLCMVIGTKDTNKWWGGSKRIQGQGEEKFWWLRGSLELCMIINTTYQSWKHTNIICFINWIVILYIFCLSFVMYLWIH